jgi:outer membrane protein TolC
MSAPHPALAARRRAGRLLAAAALAAILAGCQTFSADGGLTDVRALASVELGKDVTKIASDAEAQASRARVRELLRRPLTGDAAVQVALLNNRGLQAAFNELGLAEAEMVAASLPPNPKFSLSRKGANLELEIERQILVNVLGLLTLPARSAIARETFEAAKMKAAGEVLRLAAEARRAHVRAVASRNRVAYLAEAQAAARSASELMKKLGETGAVGKLDQAREHVFHAEIAGELARARMDHAADREALTRLMGLWGEDLAFGLPARLPALPRAARTMLQVEREAVEKNVDLRMARHRLEATVKALGLTEATRFIDLFEVAGMANYERAKAFSLETDAAGGQHLHIEREKAHPRGIEIEFEIPLFDFGETKSRRARETYMQALNQLADRAVIVRSQAREAYQRYRGAFDYARHIEGQIVPLRRTISEESLLRYNGMLTDIFPVLADARARIASQIAAIDARRDFFLAQADLKAALIGGGMNGAGPSAPALAAAGGGSAPH